MEVIGVVFNDYLMRLGLALRQYFCMLGWSAIFQGICVGAPCGSGGGEGSNLFQCSPCVLHCLINSILGLISCIFDIIGDSGEPLDLGFLALNDVLKASHMISWGCQGVLIASFSVKGMLDNHMNGLEDISLQCGDRRDRIGEF